MPDEPFPRPARARRNVSDVRDPLVHSRETSPSVGHCGARQGAVAGFWKLSTGAETVSRKSVFRTGTPKEKAELKKKIEMASRRDVAGFLADCTGCPTINEIVIKAIEEAQRGGCCALLFVAVLEPFVGVEKKMWGGVGSLSTIAS